MITIKEPCHERWDDMTPAGQGRFCNSCSKVVVDFTGFSDEELKNYFRDYSPGQTCGRFYEQQLNQVSVSISLRQVAVSQPSQRWFWAVLLVVMGSTLFSCTDHYGNKHKLHARADTTEMNLTKRVFMGAPVLPPPVPVRRYTGFKVVADLDSALTENNMRGTLNGRKSTPANSFVSGVVMGVVMEQMPQFTKGDINEYISDRLNMPEGVDSSKNVKVEIKFTVDTEGCVGDVSVVNPDPANKLYEDEAVKVISGLPPFKPGKQRGKNAEVIYTIPIEFTWDE